MPYYVCGIDEVGRGALAGPLIAVAAMFDVGSRDDAAWLRKNTPIEGVNDSKAFASHEKRSVVYHRILRSSCLVDFYIGHITVGQINRDGIDWCNRDAFFKAYRGLKREPNFYLVDGDKPAPNIMYSQQMNRPKGDSYWWPVAAASILAKVIRDTYMRELSEDHQHYCWDRNSGYGTKDHLDAIRAHGVCALHRTKFVEKYVRRGP